MSPSCNKSTAVKYFTNPDPPEMLTLAFCAVATFFNDSACQSMLGYCCASCAFAGLRYLLIVAKGV